MKQLAEITKTKAKNLLYDMFPREIVPKIHNQEKNISFSSPQASVMLINIEKFSEYSAVLTPANTFISLSKVFCKCESVLKNHPLLTKLKLVGDIYVVAAGLFDDNSVDPKLYTEEIINFGLEYLKAIKELDIIHSTDISIRIGVHIGGPVICGLVGEEMISFDVFGEPFNIAFKLQSIGASGKIRISQNVYDLVKGLSFDIEKYDDLIFQDKNRIQTYLIGGRKESEVVRLRSE
jgi:class 3 adenylate cyclase